MLIQAPVPECPARYSSFDSLEERTASPVATATTLPPKYRTIPSPSTEVALAELARTLQPIADLYRLGENWNGQDWSAPDPNAIQSAAIWVYTLFKEVVLTRKEKWIAPHVTASPDGDVVLEWWVGHKKLTAYITPDAAEYVQVWGSNISSEMAEGRADSTGERHALWCWLVN